MRKFIAVLAVAITASLVPANATALTAQDKMEQRIESLTDKSRSAHDKPGLRHDSCLDKYAERQARRQAGKRLMYHQDLGPILEDCDLQAVGENVAYGYTTAGSVQKAWMASPGHRANILQPRFKRIGVGVAKAEDGALYYAVVFGVR